MAYGKISWTPPLYKALSLDGAHYLSLADAAFNMGAGDFGLEVLVKVDSTMADAEGWICAKGAADLTNVAGWHFLVDKTNRRLGLRLGNAGGGAPTTVYSNAAAFAYDTDFVGGVTAARGGLATFYVNGAPAGTASIAAKSGSLDNSEPVKIGAYDAANCRLKALLGLVRIDQGRVLPASWFLKEYHRLRFAWYGRAWNNLPSPQVARDFLEAWNFQSTLIGLSAAARQLTWQGGGPRVFVSGYPYSLGDLTYQFTENFEWEHEESDVNLDSLERTLDSALAHSVYDDKERRRLTFNLVYFSQRTALQAAHRAKGPIRFFLDGGEAYDFRGKIMEPPSFTKVPAQAVAGEPFGCWKCELTVEEV